MTRILAILQQEQMPILGILPHLQRLTTPENVSARNLSAERTRYSLNPPSAISVRRSGFREFLPARLLALESAVRSVRLTRESSSIPGKSAEVRTPLLRTVFKDRFEIRSERSFEERIRELRPSEVPAYPSLPDFSG